MARALKICALGAFVTFLHAIPSYAAARPATGYRLADGRFIKLREDTTRNALMRRDGSGIPEIVRAKGGRDTTAAGLERLPCYTTKAGRLVIPTRQLVIQFKADADELDIERELAAMGASVVEANRWRRGRYVVEVADPGASLAKALAAAESPAIRWAEASCWKRALPRLIPTDPRFDDQWALHNTGQNGSAINADVYAERAWDVTTGRMDIVVAVIDDGFDLDHPDLAANVYSNAAEALDGEDTDGNGYTNDVRGWDFTDEDNDPSSETGDDHGTSMLGVLAATANNAEGIAGLAHGCRWLPLRAFGYGWYNPAHVADAVYYAADMADVLSISYGIEPDSVIVDALRHAAAKGRGGRGMVVCVALGNDGVLRRYGGDGATMGDVMTVGGTTRFDRRSFLSDYGPALDIVAPAGGTGLYPYLWPHMGVLTTQTNAAYGRVAGTSISAPLVAGAAALVLSEHPEWSGLRVRQVLEQSADRIDPATAPYDASGRSEQYGAGRLNAWAAVRAGLPDEDAYEGTDVAERSRTILPGQIQYRALRPASDADWSRIVLPSQSDIQLSVVGTTNAMVALYNSGLSQIAGPGPGALPFSVVSATVSAGTYYAKVTSLTSSIVTNYGLHYALLNFEDEYEHGTSGDDDEGSRARLLHRRQIKRHTLYPAGDRDWMGFVLSQTAFVEILALVGEPLPYGDTEMRLYKGVAGVPIATNDDASAYLGVTNLSSYIGMHLTPDTYFIEIRDFEDDDALSSYEMILSIGEQDDQEPDDTYLEATTITNGARVQYTTWPVGDVDWLTFTLDRRSDVLIRADAIDPTLVAYRSWPETWGDTYMQLYSAANLGTPIAFNDDANSYFFSGLYREDLAPGTYYVQVDGYSPTRTSNHLFHVAFDAYPAQTEITNVAWMGSNTVSLSWPGWGAYTYEVQTNANLLDSNGWGTATDIDGRIGGNKATAPAPVPELYYRLNAR